MKRNLKAQTKRFEKNKKFFENIYREWQRGFNQKDLNPTWREHNKKLESAFLPFPGVAFLQDPTLQYTMVVERGGKFMDEQLKLLETNFSAEELRSLLEESPIGSPNILAEKYATSHNSIHHLYHLGRYQFSTNNNISSCRSIIEWGAGYANMAKIVRRMNNKATYILVDFPIMSTLQWLYLTSVFGEGTVNIIKNDGLVIEKRKLNILPINLVERVEIKVEMFISTWGLSESGKHWQKFVFDNNLFGAKKLLLAYQDNNKAFKTAASIGNKAKKLSAKIEKLRILRGNWYAFK